MADPVIPNIPASLPADQAAFFQSLKASIEYLMGQGRTRDEDRALRVRELVNMGIEVNQFLRSTAQNPYPIVATGGSSADEIPDPPTDLVVTKGAFAHSITWANPADTIVSHIEVWAAIGSQDIVDALIVGIVTVTEDARGKQGIFVHSGFDPTADITYWIRSISYGEVYSEWLPTLILGGITVEGDDSISETIDGVVDILRGGTPELYTPDTTYRFNDRCRDSDGRVWKSISLTAFSEQSPPNATYWKRTGILMTGDVDGVPTVAIDGNLMVDGTILARHLAADSIQATHIDTNEVFIGMTIQSSNYVPGVSGWKIDKDGAMEINGGSITVAGGLDYSQITGDTAPDDNADVTADNTAAGIENQGALAVLDEIGLSLLDETVITSGAIKTGLVTAYTIGANEVIANTANIKNGIITNAKIGDAAITNAKIGAAAVDTLELAGQAVIIPVSSYTDGDISLPTWPSSTTVQTATITSTGAPISIFAYFYAIRGALGWIERNGVEVGGLLRAPTSAPSSAVNYVDTPGIGTHTYRIRASGDLSGSTVRNRTLTLLETKR